MWPKKQKFDPWKHAMEQMADKRVLLGLAVKEEEKKAKTNVWQRKEPSAFKRIPKLRNLAKRKGGWREVVWEQRRGKNPFEAFVPKVASLIPGVSVEQKLKPFSSGRAFGQALARRGFVRLGGGYYSTVYAKKDSDRVIKVCGNPDGWPSYVKWAASQGFAGGYAPKVYSYKMFDGFYVAVMERMDKTIGQLPQEHPKKFMADLFQMANMYKNDNLHRLVNELEPGLSNLAKGLKEQFNDCHIDLHSGNFMVRKDGSFVLTDPIGRGTKIKETRLRASDFTSLASLVHLRLNAFRYRTYFTSFSY